jgi:hypothetical protein
MPDCHVPYRLVVDEAGRPGFRWLDVGTQRFTQPFFEETIGRCLSAQRNPAAARPIAGADELLSAAAKCDAVEPSAFVLHVSRCGSTLLSQLMAVDERWIVLSEVPVLDEILRLPFKPNATCSTLEADELFRAAVRLLGSRRNDEEHLLIKADSWHVMFFDRIRRCYPHVPVLLLYRDPSEVLRSQQARTGMHGVPNLIEPGIFGFNREEIAALHPTAYLNRVLERYFEQYLNILSDDHNTRAINYAWGVRDMVGIFARHAGIELRDGVIAAMKLRMERHSKYPDVAYAGDDWGKRSSPATDSLEDLYRRVNQAAGAWPDDYEKTAS